MKKLFLLFLIYSISLSSQGLLNKLRDATRETVDRIRNTQTYQNVERTVESINPTEYLSNLIGSRLNIHNPFPNLNSRFAEIQSLIDEQFTAFSPDNSLVKSSFRNTNNPLNSAVNLNFLYSTSLSKAGYIINVNGRNYVPYMTNDNIFFQTSDQAIIPLNDDLNNAMKTLIYKHNAAKLNATYFRNLKSVSQIIYFISSTSYLFSSTIQRELENIGSLQYGGVTAIQVLDPITEASTGGISYSDIMAFTNSFSQSCENTMNLSRNIQNACSQISNSLASFNQNQVDYQRVVQLEQGLNTMSSEIRKLASSVSEISSDIRSSAGDLTRLANVSQFTFFSSLGNILYELSGFVSNTSNALNSYAERFNSFNNDCNQIASKYAAASKSYLVNTVTGHFNSALVSKQNLMSNYTEINSTYSDINFNDNTSYTGYISGIQSLDNSYNSELNNNLVNCTKILYQMQQMVDQYPEEEYKSYVTSLAAAIKNEQIISTPDDAEFVFASQKINQLKQSRFEDVKTITASLGNLMDNVKSNNLIFYIISGVISLGIILMLIRVNKKRKV